ncbi:hypothetical protein ACQ4PT_062280 [Festuca glaucescens]
MFYSQSILARKSPLGTVWIAAHLERKVKKAQVDGIDIPTYVQSIMFPEVPIALRLSGHLLLGLVRIYSWKVNYLFQDCNRMLSTIRTAFASVEVDLPFDADRAPFEVITLPETFNLDDLNLDDAIRQMDTPDNHRKTFEQITLSEEQYVTITLDEDARAEPSPAGRSLFIEPEPPEQGTFPPFPEDAMSVDPPEGSLPANTTNGDAMSVDPPEDSLPANTINGEQDSPERLREAPESLLSFKGVIDGSDPMDEDPSPFIYKATTPPAMDSSLSAGRGSLPGTSIPNVSRSICHDPIEDEDPSGTGISLPVFVLEPSPPQVQDNKRKRTLEVQENKRSRIFDENLVISNDYMGKQIAGKELCKLASKRKKLPHTAVDIWKYNRIRQKDSFFYEPLVHGMCTDLHNVYKAEFPQASAPVAESASHERANDVANVEEQDALPERHLTPKSPGNADVQPEQVTATSPGNAEAQPEPHLTPLSPENGDATPFDFAPELPRFSPRGNQSPVRYDDTPFKTPGGTPQSRPGRTGATEIPATYGSYASPGQSTRVSDPNGSPFPFDDELEEDLPEIPGLISTPSMISSASTGTTGLGSMSTRTRAVAEYFRNKISSASSDDQRGKFCLNGILEGRTRKQAARMFFETLALKSYDYIDVEQEEAYSDISVSLRPSLSAAKL